MATQTNHAPYRLTQTKAGILVRQLCLQRDDNGIERIGYFEEKGPHFGHVLRRLVVSHNQQSAGECARKQVKRGDSLGSIWVPAWAFRRVE